MADVLGRKQEFVSNILLKVTEQQKNVLDQGLKDERF